MNGLKAARLLLRRIGPVRTGVTALILVVALLLARYSWHMLFTTVAERALYDLRVVLTAPKVEKDDRVVMVVFNDDTLIATRKRSPLDRATLARALKAIDAMGAKAIGIDILVDQPQDEDPQLVATLKGMHTPTYLAYASSATKPDDIQYRQQQFLDGFQKAVAGPRVKAASIRLEVDSDNVVRSWPVQRASLPPLLARELAPGHPEFDDYSGSIRFQQPRLSEYPVYNKLPIDLFANGAVLPQLADAIRGRYVLIGGDIVDEDQYETPLRGRTGTTMIGLEVHATTLSQLLDDAPFKPIPPWMLWLSASSAVVLGAFSSLSIGAWWRTSAALVAQAALIAWAPVMLQEKMVDTQQLPVFGWLLGWVVAFVAVGVAARAVGSEQRKFAQSALGKYLPRDIANQIIEDPEQLTLHGERRDIFVMFTDLEGFTELAHTVDPDVVATLLNRYLDMLSDVVLAYGGTIDKFVGDGIIAFWGAPISRPDDGERAARAAYAIWEVGEQFRASVSPDVASVGRTRVGMHFGPSIVGNFGGEDRFQYTALGDSMNTASRLESANKKLGTSVIVSGEAVARSGLDWWRPMGRITLRGRATPVDIFEPKPNLSSSDLNHIRTLLDGIENDDAMARAELEALSVANPDDEALANLAYRMQFVKSGGSYVLD